MEEGVPLPQRERVRSGRWDEHGRPASPSAAPTVSSNAPVAAGVDPESLIPDGIKKNFPEIAQNYWSRMTFSKNPPKYGGTFRTQTVGDGPNLDPNDPTGVNQSFLQLFFNRLVRADMTFTTAFQGKENFLKLLLANDLAAKYEQPDPLTYTFQLNQGVKFHNVEPTNGHEFTTADVTFALDQYRQPSATNEVGILRDIDKVEAIDKYNLKITMKRPAAYFLYSLAGPAIHVLAPGLRKAGGPAELEPDPHRSLYPRPARFSQHSSGP